MNTMTKKTVRKPRFTFYIDEAGHTGDHLTNEDQRFFTMAALGIPSKDEQKIEDFVRNLKEKYRIDFELKANKLTGRIHEPIIPEIFSELFKYNYLPVFTILEKRFMVVCKIVEEFFDSHYNDHTDHTWDYPLPKKAKAANYFYATLSQQTIDVVAIAIRKGRIEDVEQAFELIFSETKDKTLKKLIGGAKKHLRELSEMLQLVARGELSEVSGSVQNSPNYTIFFSHINRIEGMLRQRSATANLVFDSSREYNVPFSDLFKRIKNIKKKSLFHFPNNTLHFGLKNLKTFSYMDSKDSIFIQLADLLSTSINSFFKKIDRHERLWKLTANEEFWLGYIYIMMDERFGDWIISSQLKKKYGKFIKEYNAGKMV